MAVVREIIRRALRKIGVVAHDEPGTAEYFINGLAELNTMIGALNNYQHSLWAVTSMSKTLTTAASYTLTPRPMRIQSMRFKQNGIETPMERLDRQQYDAYPDKTVTGVPSTYYYDPQQATGTVYIWPKLAVAAGETLEITYERQFEDTDELNVGLDAPVNFEEALLYNLAARLALDYGKDAAAAGGIGVGALQLALSADREGSVYFYECE
jgi:hypothetical protein